MRFAMLAAAAAILAAPASAATVIEFRNISGSWHSPIAGQGLTGLGTDSVRWGTGTNNKSGYDFIAATDPSLSVTPPAGSDEAIIGTFRHLNFPINAGSGIEGIKLNFNTDVYVDDVFLQNVTFVYDFAHWETPNSPAGGICADGGGNYTGVNINGCADRVKISFNRQSEGFTIDNNVYALDIEGFLLDGQPLSQFWTVEERLNEAQIRGRVVLYSEAAGGVPEPATWAMLIAGFGLVGAAARRRRSDVARATA
ncbi:THxN family PEP-CTERM protein [Sandaracinobacter sp. RS1-74]|uniref:THxN family PEP-CTERM protein n=1 Tax=Sandaracinobacteroides sayramensis TaxID=2913411 RepID=UPI001EDB03A6|nr:THxN family PEP-CTERM protein [Sandaracinobacteroides sayramensis]MCG2840291.1 THxN family PEP-CTERM protein [Sandaracinobacteroides sayramensis]